MEDKEPTPSHASDNSSDEFAAADELSDAAASHPIRLSANDQRQFAEMLLDPPPLTPAMERARIAHGRMIRQ